MRQCAILAAVLIGALGILAAASQQASDESAVRALGEQFIAAQEREDVETYLALWSATSPSIDQARRIATFLFRNIDYRFTNPAVDRVHVDADRATLRLIADREVVDSRDRKPGGEPIVRTYRGLLAVVLTCVKEGGVWRIWQETDAIQELAEALAAAHPEERDRLLRDESRLISPDLRAALASRADRLYVQQNFDAALNLLRLVEQVALEANDRAGLASAHHNIGNVHYHKKEFAEALDRYRRRLALEAELEHPEGIADAWLAIATSEYSRGDYLAALDGYERARTIRESRGDQVALADLLVGIGNVYFLLGDYEPSLKVYARARAIYERTFSTAQVTMRAVPSLGRTQLMRVLQGIGRVCTAQGDYRSAIDVYERALAMATTAADRPGMVTSLASLAEVRHLQGRADASVDLYQKAADLARELGDVDTMARALAGVGLAELVRGRPEPAVAAYQRAYVAHESRRDGRGMGGALIGLAYARAELEQFRDAVALYDRAIALLAGPEHQDALARALVGKAAALDGLGEHERALETSGRASAIAATIDSPDLAWRAAVRTGHALRHLGRPDARTAFESAIAIIERMRDEIGVDVPPAFLNDRAEPYLAMLDLAADVGDGQSALGYAERARAQMRWDMLSRTAAPIDKGLSPADRNEERTLIHEIISMDTQAARARELARPDPARAAALEERLKAARDRYAAFKQRLQTTTPRLVRWRGQAPPIDADAAIAIVPDDQTVVLQYVATDTRLHVIAIERGQLAHRTQAVSRKALAARVAPALDPAALASLPSWRGFARDLSDLLLMPVRDALNGKTLVVVIPDGMLWRVPFEALDVSDPPVSPDEPNRPFHPLVEQAAIVYASSVTTWQYARDLAAERAPTQAPPEVLAFGGPPEAAELQALADAYGPGRHAVHLGDEAREVHARAEAGSYPLLHLSSGGVVDHASPFHSRVQLGAAVRPDASHDEDDVIEAWELLNAEWKTEMAVCSAMEWPSGTLLGGDGVAGLSWAWYVAGVPSLVIARWPVPTSSRIALIGALHRTLIGTSPATPASRAGALREAARRVRHTPGMDSPLHWAGFMMVGHPD